MDNSQIERSKMYQIINAIDKRVIVFEYIKDKLYCSDEIADLLNLSKSEWDILKSNRTAMTEFFLNLSTEIDIPDSATKKYVGIWDKNEHYVIFNIFVNENSTYGFVIDKTAEIYKKFQISEELNRVRSLSQTDALTGLANRNGFETIVKKNLTSLPNTGALIIMDMDNFKLVNDMLGHPEGDLVLKKFASILNNTFQSNSIIGRIGGDEFVVFITKSISHIELTILLEQFMKNIHEKFDTEYPQQHLSASIGAVLVSVGISDYESLYKNADNALYIVKENGKGHFVIR